MIWKSALLFILLSGPLCQFAEGLESCPLKLSFVDAGEGDAIFVRYPKGGLVIDAASPIGAGRFLDYIKAQRVSDLSALFVTHPHLDHAGGVFELLRSLKPQMLYDNGQALDDEARTNDMYRWYKEVFRAAPHFRNLRRGDSLEFGELKFDVLWPPAGDLNSDWNNNSLVLRLSFGRFRALLMGDALSSTELKLVSAGVDLKASVLKAGHHGSSDTASVEFLARVAPELTVVSVNKNNFRGYPDTKALARYRAQGPVRITGEEGVIEICAGLDGRFSFTGLARE